MKFREVCDKIRPNGGERKMKPQKIENIRKKFKKPEWLLIRVDRRDESMGTLVAHSPSRIGIEERSMRGKGLLYMTHSTRKLPRGYVAAF